MDPQLDPGALAPERHHGVPVVVDHEPDRPPEPDGHLVGETLGGGDPVRTGRLAGVEGEVELARALAHPSPPSSAWRSRSTRVGSTRNAIPFSWLKVTAPGADPLTFRTCLARV